MAPNLDDVLTAAGIDSQTMKDIGAKEIGLKYLTVSSADPLSIWQSVRKGVQACGYWPVFVGSPAEFARLRPMFEAAEDLNAVRSQIETGVAFDIAEWVNLDEHSFDDDDEDDEPDSDDGEDDDFDTDDVEDDEFEPATLTEDDLTFGGRDGNELVLLLVPTDISWEVPAYLMLGRGSQMHDPYHHVAMHKRWFERYEAELISVTNDSVEMLVKAPPETIPDAERLAVEHCVYCPDLGDTVAHLAAERVDCGVWTFWWD